MHKFVVCKRCGSNRIVKFGTYKGIQLYWCYVCNCKFRDDDALFHMKVPVNIIGDTLFHYFQGDSLNFIRDYLKQKYDYFPSKSVIYRWIYKYRDIAWQVLKSYKVLVGDIWILDESSLPIDHGHVLVINVIDSETKYILTTIFAPINAPYDEQEIVAEAIIRAGKAPRLLKRKKLLNRLEPRFQPKNIPPDKINPWPRTSGIRDTARRFKDIKALTRFNRGFILNYNYFSHNPLLNGRTPAEAASTDCPYKTWEDVIRRGCLSPKM